MLFLSILGMEKLGLSKRKDKMNKCKKALNTIIDTLTYYMIRRDESLVHNENEIYDAMDVLRKLVDNTNMPEEVCVSEKAYKKSMNLPCLQKRLLIVIKL